MANSSISLKTSSTVEMINLSDIEFPAIFSIIVNPGLNKASLRATGYESEWRYFMGMREGDETHIGWASTKDGKYLSPQGTSISKTEPIN